MSMCHFHEYVPRLRVLFGFAQICFLYQNAHDSADLRKMESRRIGLNVATLSAVIRAKCEAMIIRHAREADLPTITEIFNRAIASLMTLWIETPETLSERAAWFASRRLQDFPVLVAEDGGKVIAFGSYGPFRPYEGFKGTVEHSVYVAESAQGKGVGRALLLALIDEAKRSGKMVVVAAIDSTNVASLSLHLGMGFVETGRMTRIGGKLGTRRDMVLLQKELADWPPTVRQTRKV